MIESKTQKRPYMCFIYSTAAYRVLFQKEKEEDQERKNTKKKKVLTKNATVHIQQSKKAKET